MIFPGTCGDHWGLCCILTLAVSGFKSTEFPSSVSCFFKIYLFYLFIFGCVGSSLLREGLL